VSVKKIVQLTDAAGLPIGGRVFIAPDAESLAASMADLTPGQWFEVQSEAELVVPVPDQMPWPI
jgi:hypothetical protein